MPVHAIGAATTEPLTIRLGHTLHEPLLALCRWAEEHIAEVLVNRERYDAR